MSTSSFNYTSLKPLFGFAAVGLLATALSVHPQTTSGSAGAASSGESGKSAQTGSQSGSAGGSAAAGNASGSSKSGSAGSAADGTGTKAAAGASATAGKVSKADQDMMRQMAQANLAEIETAKLAQSKSKSDEVKTYAQKMIDDHTKAQTELAQLAQSKGVQLPAEPDKKHQAAAKKLSALSDAEFDRRYMSQAGLTDHQNTHRLLQNASKRAADAELKAYASKTLPVVDEHLTMAKQMKVGKSADKRAGSTVNRSDTGASGSSATGGAGKSSSKENGASSSSTK
jgi:putative membrane protein